MVIPQSTITAINVTFIFLIIVFAMYGYFRGLIRQAIDIVVLVMVAWLSILVAPLLAENINLVPNLTVSEISIIDDIARRIINNSVWIIVLFVVFLILAGIVRMILFKNLNKSKFSRVDRYGGAALSVTIPIILGLLLVSILSLPVFENGKDIASSTVLMPLVPVADYLSDAIIESFDPSGLLEKITDGEELNEDDTESVIEIMERLGISEEIATILAKVYIGVSITQEDLDKVRLWISSEGFTDEDIRKMLKDFGLSEEEVERIMDEYNN